MANNNSSPDSASLEALISGCSVGAILDAQKLNLIAISFAGALAAKLNDNERTALSLFFATVSTALANIAFLDGIYDEKYKESAKDNQESS